VEVKIPNAEGVLEIPVEMPKTTPKDAPEIRLGPSTLKAEKFSRREDEGQQN
jgi:hypothetical protein